MSARLSWGSIGNIASEAVTRSAVTLMTSSRYALVNPANDPSDRGAGYYRLQPSEHVRSPDWDAVESAIRRMDDRSHPIVSLSCSSAGTLAERLEDEHALQVIGGDGRWALLDFMGTTWRFEDPAGSTEEDRLWESDQGFSCERRQVVTDIRAVLAMTRAYWETGSYDGLTAIGLRSRRW